MKKPLTFRKIPVEIEAIRWTGQNFKEVRAFVGEGKVASFPANLVIATLEGDMMATEGDWIIRGVAGEFYPCKPEIFAQTYETV